MEQAVFAAALELPRVGRLGGMMELLLILLGLTAIFLATSLRDVPSDPPHVAVVTLFGERLREVKEEGLRLFPFYPIVYNGILIDVTKKNQDLSPHAVRTRDYAELEISVSLTWTPNPKYAIEYLNHDAESGIRTRLEDMVRQRLREWAIARDWEEAVAAEDEATAILIRETCGLSPNLPEGRLRDLSTAIMTGDGVHPINSLGIIINRLNIHQIKLKGELSTAAELLATEQRQRDAERLELAHVQEVIAQLRDALDISPEQAIEIVQTERGKVSKKITEFKGSISPETMALIDRIIGRLAPRTEQR